MAKKAKYYVRPDGLHESIRTIGGKRVAFRGKTDREVDRKILKYKEQSSKGRTVRELVEDWQRNKEPKISEASRVAYKAPADRLVSALGPRRVKEIKPINLARILTDMQAKGFAVGAVKLQKTVLLQVFRFAVLQGDIDISPAAEIELPRGLPRSERGALSPEQISAVMRYRGPGWMLGMMALFTGCRRGELLALEWSDIDRKAGTITISKKISYATGRPVLEDHTKTAAGMRTIPLLKPLADALPKDRIGRVFHRDDGGYLLPNDLERLWRAFCDGVGLYTDEGTKADSAAAEKHCRRYPYTLHWFRHTFATICYDAGVDVKTAASILGHASEAITMEIYTHLTKSREQASAEKLEEYFADESKRAAE